MNLKEQGLMGPDDYVVDCHYRLDDMSLCVALTSGDILSWCSDGHVSTPVIFI